MKIHGESEQMGKMNLFGFYSVKVLSQINFSFIFDFQCRHVGSESPAVAKSLA